MFTVVHNVVTVSSYVHSRIFKLEWNYRMYRKLDRMVSLICYKLKTIQSLGETSQYCLPNTTVYFGVINYGQLSHLLSGREQ